MSEQPPDIAPPPASPSIPPLPPPSSRSGCVTALLVLIGVVLLLPGLCVAILSGSLAGHFGREEIQLVSACAVAAVAGIALIIWAGRRP